jgi:membrane-associated phospholipid phosphatase
MGKADPNAITLARTSAGKMALEFLAAVGVLVGLSALGDALIPSGCRWCSQNGVDEMIRRWVVADDRLQAAALSHQLSLGFLPILAILALVGPALFTTKRRAAIANFTMILNVFLLTTAIPGPFKAFTSRERPGFVHGTVTEAINFPTERFASFFSGDTAWAFAFAGVAASVSWLRGYRNFKVVTFLGYAAAFAVAVLRMRADMHWATDVTVGAVVGTSVGLGLPLIFHGRLVAPAPSAALPDERIRLTSNEIALSKAA